MSSILFVDNTGCSERLSAEADETLFQSLLRHGIPPQSVVVQNDGNPTSLFNQVESGVEYHATLLERYDIGALRELLASRNDKTTAAHTHRWLDLGAKELTDNRTDLSIEELAAFVELRIEEVVTHYDLFRANEDILFALSGGMDSTALLLALDNIRNELPHSSFQTVTLVDYWNAPATPPETALELTDSLGVDNKIITTDEISQVYGLSRPVKEVLTKVDEESDFDAVTVANDINRRLLEWYADSCGVETICLGDHASDIVAGVVSDLLSSGNAETKTVPLQQVGPYRYVYPVSFTSKQELALYRYARTGKWVLNEGFDPWERNLPERHLAYYLADILQSHCPGLIHWLSGSPTEREMARCDNCGGIRQPVALVDGICPICRLLADLDCRTE